MGIAPRRPSSASRQVPSRPPELLRPNRPFLDAAATRDADINQEVALPPVVNNRLEVGIVKGGIAQLALTQVEIMREERLDQARAVRQVPDLHFAQKYVLVEIDDIPQVTSRANLRGAGGRASSGCRRHSRACAPSPVPPN